MTTTALSSRPEASVQHFRVSGEWAERVILGRDGRTHTSRERVPQDASAVFDVGQAFDDAWLRRTGPSAPGPATPVTVADLFSGCGGLSVGAGEAARATGHRAAHVMAVDTNEHALSVFASNFPEARLHGGSIDELVDGELGERYTARERKLAASLEGLDLALGGPPCQGHSDLNNHTRRDDPKNRLYSRMARFVEVVRPRLVLVENVPGVAHDRSGVLDVSVKALKSAGYTVSTGILRADAVGAAQSRRRHILLASRDERVVPNVEAVAKEFAMPARTVLHAISDLDECAGGGVFDTAARHHAVNQRRIGYLFEHNLYDLPNEERPDCHRLKKHSYNSVYGRMHPDRPSPTITSGFGSTGQGRFVHPLRPRTLTPHEAARVQGFPDWFDFSSASSRVALQEMIGNAVPSKLAYAAVGSMLR